MVKTIKTLAVLTTIILLSSFTGKNVNEVIGTYSVFALDPAQIKLVVNSDHTFYYQDFSNLDKKIVSKGNWIIKGRKLILQGNNSNKDFHTVWAFKENGQVAKSRKGLTFYRLVKTDG